MPAGQCGSGAAAEDAGVKKWGEGVDDGSAKGVLAGDEVARQHAPGALGVADASPASEGVNRIGELDACVHNAFDERLGQQDAAGMAVGAAAGEVGDIGPVLEKNPAAIGFADDIQTAFKTDKILPGLAAF